MNSPINLYCLAPIPLRNFPMLVSGRKIYKNMRYNAWLAY